MNLSALEATLAAIPRGAWSSHLVPAAALLDVLEQWSADLRRAGLHTDAERIAELRRQFLATRTDTLLQGQVPAASVGRGAASVRLRRAALKLRSRRRT